MESLADARGSVSVLPAKETEKVKSRNQIPHLEAELVGLCVSSEEQTWKGTLE